MAYWLRSIMPGAITASLAALICGAGFGCKKEASAAMMADRPPPLVSVVSAIKQDVPLYLDEIGKAGAFESVTIMPQIAGRIDALHFTDGADITKGQLLFTIDARPFTATLHQAEGQLAKDQAALANATSFLTRQADIFKQGFVSPSDYDTAQFNAKGAKAAADADQAAIESARLNVEYCEIHSPINGRAGLRLVDPGNIVKLNETPLLVIQRLDPIYADFTINENELLRVRDEMARGMLKTLVKLPEDKEYRQGELRFLDNSVQDGSGTIKLRATLPNSDQHLWPGQFVDVRLVLKVVVGAVLVPTSVPQMSQAGPYVLVVKDAAGKDGKPTTIAEMRPVKLGQRHSDLIVVESGVAAGESVITDGQMLVQPGGPVKVLPSAPPASQPASAMK